MLQEASAGIGEVCEDGADVGYVHARLLELELQVYADGLARGGA